MRDVHKCDKDKMPICESSAIEWTPLDATVVQRDNLRRDNLRAFLVWKDWKNEVIFEMKTTTPI